MHQWKENQLNSSVSCGNICPAVLPENRVSTPHLSRLRRDGKVALQPSTMHMCISFRWTLW